MNVLLIFFALPVATVILAIVLQKILRSPLLVAATFFAIYLIVTFSAFDISFLVYAILYTILAYVTAVLTKLVCNLIHTFRNINLNNTNSQAIIELAENANTTNNNTIRRNNCCCNRRM